MDQVTRVVPRRGAFPVDPLETENWRLSQWAKIFVSGGGTLHIEAMLKEPELWKGPYRAAPPVCRLSQFMAGADGQVPEVDFNLMAANEFDAIKEDRKGAEKVWRLAGRHSFTKQPLPDKVRNESEDRDDSIGIHDLIEINDTGNAFRRTQWKEYFCKSRSGAKGAIGKLKNHKGAIVCAIHRPLPFASNADVAKHHPLWESLESHFRARSLVITNLWDLRIAGARVTRGLSWEKTASELLKELDESPLFQRLKKIRWLVVPIMLEGAVCVYQRGETRQAWLLFDPLHRENQYTEKRDGTMLGYTNLVTTYVAKQLFEDADGIEDVPGNELPPDWLRKGVTKGLTAGRRLLDFGLTDQMEYPIQRIFESVRLEGNANEIFRWVKVPNNKQVSGPNWSVMGQLQSATPLAERLLKIAEIVALVKNPFEERDDGFGDYAQARKDLLQLPLGQFGDLRSYDRTEIETLSEICNLFGEYFGGSATNAKPISIAVFGPPGSGKSFCVREVAEEVKGKLPKGTKLAFLPVNLSQFGDPRELGPVFHSVRDSHLRGQMPLVFFDEFDSSMHGIPLFWLKHFLAPMQDGEFLENGLYHPIGRAVFVFAGGISANFDAFSNSKKGADLKQVYGTLAGRSVSLEAQTDMETARRNAKLPDFLSRLRGTIDVPGLNYDHDRDNCEFRGPKMLRRAMFIRSRCSIRAENIFFDGGKVLDIHKRLLRALLTVDKFVHGARSLQAIIEMASLNRPNQFDAGCLPSDEQLSAHVEVAVLRRKMDSQRPWED